MSNPVGKPCLGLSLVHLKAPTGKVRTGAEDYNVTAAAASCWSSCCDFRSRKTCNSAARPSFREVDLAGDFQHDITDMIVYIFHVVSLQDGICGS